MLSEKNTEIVMITNFSHNSVKEELTEANERRLATEKELRGDLEGARY